MYIKYLGCSYTDVCLYDFDSTRGEYGVVNTGKQALTLLGVAKYSDRVFDHSKRTSLWYECS